MDSQKWKGFNASPLLCSAQHMGLLLRQIANQLEPITLTTYLPSTSKISKALPVRLYMPSGRDPWENLPSYLLHKFTIMKKFVRPRLQLKDLGPIRTPSL
jgi:hypothetical protein